MKPKASTRHRRKAPSQATRSGSPTQDIKKTTEASHCSGLRASLKLSYSVSAYDRNSGRGEEVDGEAFQGETRSHRSQALGN